MTITGIGKQLLDSLRKEGFVLKFLDQEQFVEQMNKVSFQAMPDTVCIYSPSKDLCYVNTGSKQNKEHIAIYQMVAAIRIHKDRMHTQLKPLIPKKAIALIKSTKTDSLIARVGATLMMPQLESQVASWVNKSVADSVGIFFCTLYGDRPTRHSLNYKNTFFPLLIDSLYSKEDWNAYLKQVQSESLKTIKYILSNHLSGLYDYDLMAIAFKEFFKEEISYNIKHLKEAKAEFMYTNQIKKNS